MNAHEFMCGYRERMYDPSVTATKVLSRIASFSQSSSPHPHATPLLEYLHEGLRVRDLWGHVGVGDDLIDPQPGFLYRAWPSPRGDILIMSRARVPVGPSPCTGEFRGLIHVH